MGDIAALAGLAMVGVLCLSFRYLPMVDLPQHYAMVSIITHYHDLAYGFAQRYTFDWVTRPYATVYWLAAALARGFGLNAAMRIVVALCTVAPLAGAYALLRATGRPRFWVLLAVPFAFGSIWHWGFLNFLLGTGLFLGGLALVVRTCRVRSRLAPISLGALGMVAFFTHLHGLVMLLFFAPAFVWGYHEQGHLKRELVRVGAALVLPAVAGAAFMLLVWLRAHGNWATMNPGFMDRVESFPEFLGGGWPDPWPAIFLVGFVTIPILAFVLVGFQGQPKRRELLALGFLLAGQIVMYFVFPLNTKTATYVSARHAIIIVLCLLPLLPSPQGWPRGALLAACGAFGVFALVATAGHLGCFNREASDFDPVLNAVPQNQRIASLIFDKHGACTSPRTFPYLHFPAYAQALHGGELSRSFAVVWNVPIRYRHDYKRYPMRDRVEWAPWEFSPEDLRHFDYLIVRGPAHLSPDLHVDVVKTSGAWTLFKNPDPLPARLPAP